MWGYQRPQERINGVVSTLASIGEEELWPNLDKLAMEISNLEFQC